MVKQEQQRKPVEYVTTDERREDEPCERLTPGCCVRHRGHESCETW